MNWLSKWNVKREKNCENEKSKSWIKTNLGVEVVKLQKKLHEVMYFEEINNNNHKSVSKVG